MIENENEVTCCICLEKINTIEIEVLLCNHIFHSSCITDMFQYGENKVCPLCRTDIGGVGGGGGGEEKKDVKKKIKLLENYITNLDANPFICNYMKQLKMIETELINSKKDLINIKNSQKQLDLNPILIEINDVKKNIDNFKYFHNNYSLELKKKKKKNDENRKKYTLNSVTKNFVKEHINNLKNIFLEKKENYEKKLETLSIENKDLLYDYENLEKKKKKLSSNILKLENQKQTIITTLINSQV